MERQQFTPEQSVAKLREVDVLVGRGATAVEACRQTGIAGQALYRWRKEYDGLKIDQPPCFAAIVVSWLEAATHVPT